MYNYNRNSHLHGCNRKINQHKCNKKNHLHNCNKTSEPALFPQTFTCIISTESVSFIVPTKTVTCRIDYKHFYLEKWCQSKILLVAIKKLSEWVTTKVKEGSFSISCTIYWRNLTVHFLNFLIFIHITSQIISK